MPTLSLENPVFISVDGAGRPNAGGTVGVYVAGTSFGTLATIYSDQVKTSELTNPITLDDAGTKEIWFDVKVDIQEKTKAGVLIRDTLNIDPNANATVSTGFNLASNGSFETDSDSDGQPDSWTISPYVGSDIAITSDVVTDGTKALEFNTGAAGTGGGTATSAKFPVTEGTVCSVAWSFYATNATTLNTFQIKWYDEDDVLKSTSTLTMPASGSVPTSWTNYTEEVTADAAATQGEIVLTGISSGGTNLSSKAYFDGIKIVNLPNMVTLDGTQTITGDKTFSGTNIHTEPTINSPVITTPTITSPDIDQVVDSSGNEAHIFAEVASAVNEITETNAASGNKPSLNQTGTDDVGIDIEGVELHNGTATTSQSIVSAAAATYRSLIYQTSGSIRWIAAANSTTETGTNVGSDYELLRYDDTGTSPTQTLLIARNSGLATFENLSPASLVTSSTAGAIGTYAFLGENTLTSTAAGGTQLGSNLRYAGISTTDGWNAVSRTLQSGHGISTAISGTWMAMGYSYSNTTTIYPATLWLRIA